MPKEISYRQQGAEIYCEKICVARVSFYNGVTGLRILQGMSREDTVAKIKTDLPTFFSEFGIQDNIRPRLFTQAVTNALHGIRTVNKSRSIKALQQP